MLNSVVRTNSDERDDTINSVVFFAISVHDDNVDNDVDDVREDDGVDKNVILEDVIDDDGLVVINDEYDKDVVNVEDDEEGFDIVFIAVIEEVVTDDEVNDDVVEYVIDDVVVEDEDGVDDSVVVSMLLPNCFTIKFSQICITMRSRFAK